MEIVIKNERFYLPNYEEGPILNIIKYYKNEFSSFKDRNRLKEAGFNKNL